MPKRPDNKTDSGFSLPPELPELLLNWYDLNARILPWRRDRDPYRVWVSEIMLQQTGASTVADYFKRFVAALPTVASLDAADEEQVLKLWEGLGYYSRARNLKKAAGILMREYNGRFPETADGLRRLPGIGPYTAGAIASIGFEQPEPAVDGNVARVAARLTDTSGDAAVIKKQAAAALGAVYPDDRRGDFTQSLMELGALICVPNGAPKCDSCPASSVCRAHQNGTAAVAGIRQKKTAKKLQELTVFILKCGNTRAVRRRAASGLLGGLWELPNVEGHLTDTEAVEQASRWGVAPVSIERAMRREHVFTHIKWDMLCYVLTCRAQPDCFVWPDADALDETYPLPTAFKKLLSD